MDLIRAKPSGKRQANLTWSVHVKFLASKVTYLRVLQERAAYRAAL
jgi:hypothetical protein